MKFEYELSKNNYEQIIKGMNEKHHTVYIILFSLIYLLIVKDLLVENFLIMLITYLILVIIMYILIKLVNKVFVKITVKMNEKSLGVRYGVYKCTLTKEKFVEELNGTKISILFKDITKTKLNKNCYYVYTKKMIIAFNKVLFKKEDDFYKVIEFIEKNKDNKKVYNKKEM